MSPPDLSICIVNWNGKHLLRDCLVSIRRAQATLNVETIVVDNASADDSVAMVVREFPWVTLISNLRNLGFSKANNQAADVSTGRYLLFLNNDTIVRPDSLRELVTYMTEHAAVGMAGPRLIGRDGMPQRSYRYRPTLAALLHRITLLRWTGLFRRAYLAYRRREFDPNTARTVEALLGAAVCLPREAFFAHGGWDEQFPFGLEDFDLSARVAQTHQVTYVAGADIVHLGKMSSRRNAGFAYTGVECGYARYLRKHALGPVGTACYKLLVTLNLPLALVVETLRHAWRTLRHGRTRPDETRSELSALWHFSTRGLRLFWRV